MHAPATDGNQPELPRNGTERGRELSVLCYGITGEKIYLELARSQVSTETTLDRGQGDEQFRLSRPQGLGQNIIPQNPIFKSYSRRDVRALAKVIHRLKSRKTTEPRIYNFLHGLLLVQQSRDRARKLRWTNSMPKKTSWVLATAISFLFDTTQTRFKLRRDVTEENKEPNLQELCKRGRQSDKQCYNMFEFPYVDCDDIDYSHSQGRAEDFFTLCPR